MNECFFIGTIIEKEKFKFILNEKHKSKIEMKIKLIDGNIVKIVAYDEKADYIFRNNFTDDMVFIQGKIKNKNKQLIIIIKYIEKIFNKK